MHCVPMRIYVFVSQMAFIKERLKSLYHRRRSVNVKLYKSDLRSFKSVFAWKKNIAIIIYI